MVADPKPNPAFFGWGDKKLTVEQNRAAERGLQESLDIACTAKACMGASPMLPKIEAVLRKKMKFDEGWDCMVAERFVYGLDDLLTLMIKQNMGNCVGDSHCCLLSSRIAHEVLAEGDAEEPLGKGDLGVPFIPYSYGVGRWVGGITGNSDGSYCGAQIEGTQKYGFLPCFTPGLEQYGGTLPQSTSSVGKLFGRNSTECKKWVDKAASFDLEEAPICRSSDDAKELIGKKHTPLQICSGIMPGGRVETSMGFPVYTGWASASHSTQLVCIFAIKGKWFVVCRNQWGYDAHRGAPEIGIPRGCLVFPIENLAYWLKRAECIGIGEIKGLPSVPPA